MEDHLTEEELELLNERALRGKGLLKALTHLEVCAECRLKIKPPTKEEILKRLEPDPPFKSR